MAGQALLIIAAAALALVVKPGGLHVLSASPYPQCGAASLYATAHTLGLRVTYADVAKLVRLDKNGDTNFWDLKSAANTLGLQAAGKFVDSNLLAGKHPVGILQIEPGHFAAIVAYDANGLRLVDLESQGRWVEQKIPFDSIKVNWARPMLVISR